MSAPSSLPPHARAFGLAVAFQGSQVLRSVLKYGFISHLKDGPKSGQQLAALAGTSEDHTCRLLRAAASLGVLAVDPGTLHYSINDVSRVYLEEPSVWLGLFTCSPHVIETWGHLDKTVKDGSYAHEAGFGNHLFDYFKARPELSEEFNKAMITHGMIFPAKGSLAKMYDFSKFKHVVDLGGGYGTLTCEVLQAHPHLTGTNFDMPIVIEEAKTNKPPGYGEVQSRFTHVGGSFFDSVPAGGDVYLMKYVAHHWNDTKLAKILSNVKAVLPDHGKIILIEQLVEEANDLRGHLLDLHMLTLWNGRARTRAEFAHVFATAGLQQTNLILLPGLPDTKIYAIEVGKI